MGNDFAGQPDLPWSDSFRVGVAQLDEEHRALVDQINAVCHHLRAGHRREALQAFDNLLAMAARHFENEEAVMRGLNGFDALDNHASEHRNRLV